MSESTYVRRPRPDPRRRGRTALRIAVALGTLAVVFALGVALGEALHQDGPRKGEPATSLRTLTSLPPA